MTHSNFPIWSKLLMYYLCKNAVRARRSQKRGRSIRRASIGSEPVGDFGYDKTNPKEKGQETRSTKRT